MGRELAKEESMLVVMGRASSRRGRGDYKRFLDRVCSDQASKGRFFVCEVDAEITIPGSETVRGRSSMWATNSTNIAEELVERRRGSGSNQEDDIAAIVRGLKNQLRAE